MRAYKLDRTPLNVQQVISYRCPYCELPLDFLPFSPNLWTCEKCKKTFQLSFRELIGELK